MSIPSFVGPAGLLPPGDHEATLSEIKERFCWNYRRTVIYNGLEYVVGELTNQRVTIIWVDGSFVTSKERPRDVDVACEVPAGGDPATWGWCSPQRQKDLKNAQHVHLFHCWCGQQRSIKDFFCQDRDGTSKGIIRLMVGGNRDT
jgi:hypothetical protein